MRYKFANPYWTIVQRDGFWYVLHHDHHGFNIRIMTCYGWPKTMTFSDN